MVTMDFRLMFGDQKKKSYFSQDILFTCRVKKKKKKLVGEWLHDYEIKDELKVEGKRKKESSEKKRKKQRESRKKQRKKVN